MNKTGIPYLDRAWNPVRGCSHCGPACDNCYAEAIARRFNGEIETPDTPDRVGITIPQPFYKFTDGNGWNGRVELLPDKLDEPLRSRKPQRVGVCFMSDLFHESLPDADILSVFQQIGKSPLHTFVILTKRWKRLYHFLSPRRWRNMGRCPAMGGDFHVAIIPGAAHRETDVAFLPNVWLGVSAWDQPSLDAAAGWLDKTPAAVKWISLEPQLARVTFRWAKWQPMNPPGTSTDHLDGLRRFSWIVQGCESGPKRRPFDLDWARSIRDECAEAGVKYYLKQAEVDGRVVEHPELDGRVWRELPGKTI